MRAAQPTARFEATALPFTPTRRCCLLRGVNERLDDVVRPRLSAALSEQHGRPVAVRELLPLSGGACQDNFRVVYTIDGSEAPRTVVLRSDAPQSLPRSLARRQEYPVIEAAVAAGVRTPAVHGLFEDLLIDGASAYLMDFADGIALGGKVTRAPQFESARGKLADQTAIELAKIHTINPRTNPNLFDGVVSDPVENGIASVTEMVDQMIEPHPALELALSWLDAHRPVKTEVVLNHGDYRTGNFLVDPQAGLTAILDWEFAQWGAPEEDVAWLCVRDWRFGVLDKPVGGFACRAPFYAAYAKASGRHVDPAVVHFFEVLGNVRWATGCVYQGERYLSGERADFELIAIGRRVAEMEFEALRLIERGS